MGNKYGSITYPQQDIYIPKYLNQQYPYAVEGDMARVAYRSYNNGTTAWVVEEYLHDGSNWARDLHLEVGNAPYKKINGDWAFDPSMTIILNPDKSDYSKMYYMAAFEWVYAYSNHSGGPYTQDTILSSGRKSAGCSVCVVSVVSAVSSVISRSDGGPYTSISKFALGSNTTSSSGAGP